MKPLVDQVGFLAVIIILSVNAVFLTATEVVSGIRLAGLYVLKKFRRFDE